MAAGRRRVFVAGAAISILLSLAFVLTGCTGQSREKGVDDRVTNPGVVDPTASASRLVKPTATALPTAEPTTVDPRALEPTAIGGTTGESSSIREITVGPARRECYGPFRRMCLIVDGGFFYEEIDGFTHEPGYEYRLRVERYDAFPGQKEPPQDAGRYGYRLLAVLSKTRIAGSVQEATVAPARVQCPKSDERCLLVDGRPLRNSIDGFQYAPGFEYHVRFESFEGGTRRLLEIVNRAPVSGTEVEISVGPSRVGCYEDAPITAACIVVNDEPYYGVIEEFPRRHGFEYRLRVERYDLFPGVDEPPPELPKYGYRLLEVLSEMPASSPPSSN